MCTYLDNMRLRKTIGRAMEKKKKKKKTVTINQHFFPNHPNP